MSRYYNDPQEGLIPTSGYIIDTKNQTTTFTSSDVANTSDATSWTAVSKLDSGETQKSMFAKISQMFKNIRYLYKMLGTTDISTIGDGTVTGGLSNLNSALNVETGFISRHTTISSNDGKLEAKAANGIVYIYGQVYTIEAFTAGAWKKVGSISKYKPSATVPFTITTYNNVGVGYGRVTASGDIDICPMVALSGTSPVGQAYFNFTY